MALEASMPFLFVGAPANGSGELYVGIHLFNNHRDVFFFNKNAFLKKFDFFRAVRDPVNHGLDHQCGILDNADSLLGVFCALHQHLLDILDALLGLNSQLADFDSTTAKPSASPAAASNDLRSAKAD
jgi:hypothetical protein